MSGLLLDSHVLLWWRAGVRLGPVTRAALAAAPAVYVSAASGWELHVKAAAGRLEIPTDLDADIEDAGFRHLPITFHHGTVAGSLPLHHRDPFDRMLIAQCMAEHLALVTSDRQIAPYGIPILPATA